MVLNSGNIDLSSFPPGNVLITVTLGDDAYNAGFRLPTDGYQAVALAIDPPGAPTAPAPVFGQGNWPAGFLDARGVQRPEVRVLDRPRV